MKSVLTAILALGALTIGTAGASARDHHGHFSFGITIGGPGYGPGWYDGYDRWDEPVHVVRPVHGCTPNRASSIARDYGFRHRAVYVSSRTVTVTGTVRGRPSEITFARAPGCPVVSY